MAMTPPRPCVFPLHPIFTPFLGRGPAVHTACRPWGAALWAVCPTVPSALSPQAKLGDEILDYRDLAALPKSKAIYNIDRPDMISYSPYVSHSGAGRQSRSEVGAAPAGGARAGGPVCSLPPRACTHPPQRGPGGLCP